MEHTAGRNNHAVPEANIISHFLSSMALTILIFCTDEGYYDFRWMLDIGNWIVFPMYALPVMGVFMIIHFLLFRDSSKWTRLLISGILSVLLILFLMAILFWS